jgi:hypothetical protein
MVRRGGVASWLARALGVWCIFAGLAAGRAQDSVSKEYQIKAAYLYNFAKFVEWPAPSFTNRDSPLVIGIFGQNPFGDELTTIARDHKINGRPIVIKAVASAADAAGVHLMFFAVTEDARIPATLVALKGEWLLTVGESDRFVASGGVINFVRESDKVRFEINTAAAGRHQLKLSAQLLKLAKTIRQEP